MGSKSVKMDLEFCEFYFKAIKKLVGFDDLESSGFKPLRKFIQRLSVDSNRFQMKRSKITALLEDTLYYRITWIYQNSTCLSSAIADHFMKATMENPKIMSELLSKKELKICSVSRGAPSDVVALVKILESIVGTNEEVDIRISIIHSDKKWRTTCLVVLRCLERFQNALWKIDFIESDFWYPCGDNVKQAIKNADIMTLVKYLGEFDDTEKKIQKSIFKRIHENLKPGSLLFLLDDYEIITKAATGNSKGEIPGYDMFYEAACSLHLLSVAAIVKHYHLYHSYLGNSLCNTSLKLFCRIWLKLPQDCPTRLSLESIEAEKRLDVQRERCAKFTRECFLMELCYAWEAENYFKPLLNGISGKRKKFAWDRKEVERAKRPIKLEQESKIQLLRKTKKEEGLEIRELKKLESELLEARKAFHNLHKERRKVQLENMETIDARQEIYLLAIERLVERLEQKYLASSGLTINETKMDKSSVESHC